ncbi:MAG: hypothetical protein AB1Z98_12685, partial [Nannocystaceae bacterium]
LALVVLLAAAGPLGCSPSTELKRVRTPREGVSLSYALPLGQGFEGQLRVGNIRAVDGLEQPLSQTATCDVTMVVLGPVEGGLELRATFTSVDLDWDLPPAATYSTDELVELAAERLRGMQVRFVVRPDGRVQTLPAAPANAPPELAEVIETLLYGLEAFFVPLPSEPLGRRDEWTESFSHTTAAGMRLSLDQTLRLDGSFRHRTDGDLRRRLVIEQSRRAQRPGVTDPITVEREITSVIMMTADGFPAEIDRETKEFDPELGMVFRKVRAEWSRFRGVVPELINMPGGDVQVITDPCNPDYVGPQECEEQPPPPPVEPAAAAPASPEDDGEDEDASDTTEAEAPPVASDEQD